MPCSAAKAKAKGFYLCARWLLLNNPNQTLCRVLPLNTSPLIFPKVKHRSVAYISPVLTDAIGDSLTQA